jgi:hypothetical protein
MPVAIALLGLFGCPTTPSEDLDLDAVLTERGGCDDLVVFARDPEGVALLDMQLPGVVGEAYAADDPPQVREIELPDASVLLELVFGTRVGPQMCNLEPPEFIVDHAYLATSGRASLVIGPAGRFPEAEVSLTLTDIVFEHVEEVGDPLRLPSMTLEVVTPE